MPTSILPFSFKLAQAKFREQKEKLNTEMLGEAIKLAIESLTSYLGGGQIANLLGQYNETFYFAAYEEKGWCRVHLLDSKGLQCVVIPPTSNPDNNPIFCPSTPYNTIMDAVNYGGFKAEEILPALQHKIAHMRMPQ